MRTTIKPSMTPIVSSGGLNGPRGRALLAMAFLACVPAYGQTSSAAQGPPRLPNGAPPYLTESGIEPLVCEYLLALGDRLQKPGSERYTLTGVANDSKYGSTAATLVWQVPGSVRFERGGGAPWLIYNNTLGLITKAPVSDEDEGVWESVLDDTAEAFLYGFARGNTYRFLGGRFHPEGTDVASYTGPLYDIFIKHGPVQASTGGVTRDKYFYFDSVTRLPARTAYQTSRAGQQIIASTEFADWSAYQGQMFPGKITRKEDEKIVFTFTIRKIVMSQFENDGQFVGQ